MQIILLQDVKTLGKKGDTVNVNDGYARNFIIPKKLGIEATPKNINDLKLQKVNEEKRAQEKLEEAKAFAQKIEEKPVKVKLKIGEGGKTFGSISTKEIAKEVKEQLGFEIDKKKIVMDTIKLAGGYEIDVKLYPEVSTKMKVIIVPQA